MTEITDYASLLVVGKQQTEPQRFLFVFLKALLPEDHTDEDKAQFQAGNGGELNAVICVDKDLAELTNFTDLVAESKQMEQEWDIVLVACLSGRNSIPPTSEEAEQPLKMMVKVVQDGGDLSKYLAFDKQGEMLNFS